MRESPPIIRLRYGDGSIAARDGVVLSFFIHRDHQEVAPAVWRALQLYLRAVPANSLNWYDSDDGDTAPLDDKGWEVIRERLLERTWGTAWTAELSGNDSQTDGYHFEYYGRKLDEPTGFLTKAPTTGVSFTVPTEYLLEHGPGALRALAFKLAWELPFSFGYASLAVVAARANWVASQGSDLDVLLTRYLGVDLYFVEEISDYIGTGARGAYWLTFLGQPLLGQLGGGEGLRRELPFPEVALLPLDSQRLLISLGERPDPIDTQQGPIPPQYRALAKVLEPFLYNDRDHGVPPEETFMYPWLRRLCR